MSKLDTKSKCIKCAGCFRLRDPEFRGIRDCREFSHKQPRVWCADETIARFIRTRKVV